jgi:hypothetical protein
VNAFVFARAQLLAFGFWRTLLVSVLAVDLLIAAATRLALSNLSVVEMATLTSFHLAAVSVGLALSALAVTGQRKWLQWSVWAAYTLFFVFPMAGRLRVLYALG